MRNSSFLARPSERKIPQQPHGISEIAARRSIKPLRQGELDWFCGLYSCLNAMRLAVHATKPMSLVLAKTLYREGIAYLDDKAAAGVTATEGMYPGRQRRLLAHLVNHSRNLGIEVTAERPTLSSRSAITDVFRWIEDSIAQGAAVMVYLDGCHDHYSVIAGIDDKHLHMFDSTAIRRVTRALCGTRKGRHIIDPRNLVAVRAAA